MKTVKNLILGILLVASTVTINAQKNEVKTVSLEQTKGAFTQQSVTLSPGDYIFEIANSGVEHEVGFVLTPKGKTDQKNHIKNAYVISAVKTGEKSKSNVVTLKKGEYTYFCPLNPTPEYTLIVK